jgi:NADH-quinone oxidoreductase subunit N
MALNLLGNNIKPLLFAFGIFSIFIGTVYAIIQKRLKRLIIYSSIAQTGFLISALSVNSTNGFLIVFFYLIIYIITSFLIWSNFSLFLNFKINSNLFEKKNLSPLLISSFINYFKFDKVLSFTFVLIFFSIAGIPPFAGFLAKILVLYELINQNYIYISIFLIIISSFSVFYYIRIIKTTFFEPISSDKRIKEFISINNLEIHYNYINISLGLYFLIFLFFLSEYIILFFQFIIYS